ncbi:MAG: putative LPS assembly protein LptD [Salibacteraceae bacterium]
MLILAVFAGHFQTAAGATDNAIPLSDIFASSSILLLPDTNDSSTATPDSNAVEPADEVLEDDVSYKAVDSMLFDIVNQRVYLYGEAEVTYQNIFLKASYIEISLKNKELYATGMPDSTGTMQGTPHFKEGEQGFDAQSMRYNFESKKGQIITAVTQDGDGYVHGDSIKKVSETVIFIKDGSYTTCSDPHPHFEIHARKLKLIQNDKIVTGPAYLKVEDVPTPLALPFGFFPQQNTQRSGLIIPSYGNSPGLGYFLQDGGYYFGMSEYWDLALTGDIYSRGSWSGNVLTRYRSRYKFNGNLNFEYAKFFQSQREFPDFSEAESFFLRWRHNQDPKARPNSSFSADVNAGTPQNFQTNFNSTGINYLTNTFKSNITYNKRFANAPFNMVLNASHDQNANDSLINLTLPRATLNMTRIFPLKQRNRVGAANWRNQLTDNLGFSMQSNFESRVSENQDDFLREETLDQIRTGMRHNIPISSSMKLFKYLTLAPSASYREVWYLETIRKSFDEDAAAVVDDTVAGFERFGEISFNGSLTTKLYNTTYFKKGFIKALRHVATPAVSFQYKPDYSDPRFNYYRTLEYFDIPDTSNRDSTVFTSETYSIFQNGIYGSPSRSEAGVIGFSLQNTFAMKVASNADSTGSKKISILDAFNLSSSYNINLAEFRWAPVRVTARTGLGKNLSLQMGGTFDPYAIDSAGTRIHEAAWDVNDTPLRFTNGNVALNLNLTSKQGREAAKQRQSRFGTVEELNFIHSNPDYFVDFNVPWKLNIAYNLNYSKPGLDATLTNTFNFSGDLNLTPKWKIGFRSGYDFESRDFTFTTIDIYRDLHCWDFSLNLVPFGARQSYTFNIKVKAPILQDLKLNRRRAWFDFNQ